MKNTEQHEIEVKKQKQILKISAAIKLLPNLLEQGNFLLKEMDAEVIPKYHTEFTARCSEFRCRALNLLQLFGNCEHFQHADYVNENFDARTVVAQTVGALRAAAADNEIGLIEMTCDGRGR